MQDKREETECINGDPTDEAIDTAEINKNGARGCVCCGEEEECHIEWTDD